MLILFVFLYRNWKKLDDRLEVVDYHKKALRVLVEDADEIQIQVSARKGENAKEHNVGDA